MTVISQLQLKRYFTPADWLMGVMTVVVVVVYVGGVSGELSVSGPGLPDKSFIMQQPGPLEWDGYIGLGGPGHHLGLSTTSPQHHMSQGGQAGSSHLLLSRTKHTDLSVLQIYRQLSDA